MYQTILFSNTVFSSVQFSHSVMSSSLRPHESQHARPPCPSPTPKLMSIESVIPSSHLVLCRPLFSSCPPPSIRVFSNESTLLMRWPEYWSFSFGISPSSEHPGLISCYSYWKVVLTFQFNLFTSIHPLNYLIVILWKFRVFLKRFSPKLSVRAGRSWFTSLNLKEEPFPLCWTSAVYSILRDGSVEMSNVAFSAQCGLYSWIFKNCFSF